MKLRRWLLLHLFEWRFREELAAISVGLKLAVFRISLTMEAVWLCRRNEGMKMGCGKKAGVIGLEWVYNSIPPVVGQI